MGKLAIETRGLKKSFGKTHAVAGVDLAVSAGGVTVWVVSGLLALGFLGTGAMKVFPPEADVAALAEGVPVVLMRIAGVAEILGALGLILPAATRIMPILTPLAASGLVVTMIGATIANLVIGEYASIVQTIIFGALAAFVACARFGPYVVERYQARNSRNRPEVQVTEGAAHVTQSWSTCSDGDDHASRNGEKQ